MIKQTLITIVAIVIVSVFATMSQAAIPKRTLHAMNIIKTPLSQRIALVRKGGKKTFKELRKIAFNPNQTLKVRWKAFTTIAIVGQKNAEPEIHTAIKSKDWFLRDAGLLAAEKYIPKLAKKEARRLISDPALVVRTTAVGVLKRLKDKRSRGALWKKLYAQENYRWEKSLWIRRHIVEALAKLESRGAEKRFIKVLDDPDTTLHKPAIVALERLTGRILGKKKEPVKFKKVYWKKWWQKKDKA